MAQQLIEEGRNVVVALTDRVYERTLLNELKKAHGRTVLFPTNDVSLISVKAVYDEFIETRPFEERDKFEKISPFRLHESSSFFGMMDGRVSKIQGRAHLLMKNLGVVMPVLFGSRKIKGVPNAQGKMLLTELLKTKSRKIFFPVMSWEKVLDIHRLVQLPQLLEKDIDLEYRRKKMSFVLNLEHVISMDDLINQMVKMFGENEAIKWNYQMVKKTMHAQDFSFLQEHDWGELEIIEDFLVRYYGFQYEDINEIDRVWSFLGQMMKKMKVLEQVMMSFEGYKTTLSLKIERML